MMDLENLDISSAVGVAIAVALLILLAFLLRKKMARVGLTAGSFGERKFLGGSELKLFEQLVRCLPNCFVFPNVAVGSLIRLRTSARSIPRAKLSVIEAAKASFVICRRNSMTPLCVVEIDDGKKATENQGILESILKEAGLPTLRFKANNDSTDAVLAAHIQVIEDWKKKDDDGLDASAYRGFLETRIPNAEWLSMDNLSSK
ncbi:DUF2726 domain-containing protein [Paucibacter soli]|uniref:DUF2726 domain-containing protein n=1 Tax=Paucibacter soli TaxID=3133433 RepID=UPI00309CBD66